MELEDIALFIIWTSVVVGFIIYGYYFGSTKKALRKLKKTPFKSPSQIQSGQIVKLKGQALHANSLQLAPVSNRPCVLYQTSIAQKLSNKWKLILEDTSQANFFIQCNDELVLIIMNQAENYREIILNKDYSISSGFLKSPSVAFENYLKKHQKQTTNLLGFNTLLRYKEGIIENKEPIVVMGTAQWKSLETPIAGYSYSKILSIEGTTTQKMIITDLKEAQMTKV